MGVYVYEIPTLRLHFYKCVYISITGYRQDGRLFELSLFMVMTSLASAALFVKKKKNNQTKTLYIPICSPLVKSSYPIKRKTNIHFV